MDLNAFDVLLLVLAGLLVTAGLLKGLTRLLTGIGALVAAFVLAAHFHGPAAEAVLSAVDMPQSAANVVGYAAIFLGTTLAGALISRIMRVVLEAAMLGWADRLAGAAAGLLAALFAAAFIVLPATAYFPGGERLLRNSLLAAYYVSPFADTADQLAPENFAEEYREWMKALRRHWSRRWDEAGTDTAGDDESASRRESE